MKWHEFESTLSNLSLQIKANEERVPYDQGVMAALKLSIMCDISSVVFGLES